MESHEDSTNGGFNHLSISLMFRNPIRIIKKKIKESQKIVRNAAIAVGRHVSPLRGKG